MKEKRLVAARIKTPDGTLLWSRFTHDYVSYTDANGETYVLDGGPSSGYIRTSVNEIPATPMHVYDDAPWGIQRTVILRGTFDSKGNRVWVPLSKLSDGHIKALTEECHQNESYHQELKYRLDNNIEVPEHDYDNEGVNNIYPPYEKL